VKSNYFFLQNPILMKFSCYKSAGKIGEEKKREGRMENGTVVRWVCGIPATTTTDIGVGGRLDPAPERWAFNVCAGSAEEARQCAVQWRAARRREGKEGPGAAWRATAAPKRV
jgi:hypothetical protein